MTDLALKTPLPPQPREYLELVRTSGDLLLRVINDILDFSKIEAGKLDLEPVEFGMRRCIGEVVEVLGVRAQQKGLELTCEIAPHVPDELVGDPDRLRQVLVNLVGNAVKFTEKGEVVVCVSSAACGLADSGDPAKPQAAEVELHFEVRDTGIGIPADKLDQIFEPFVQADGSTRRKHGGTGLGLTISARLVGMMGGRIWTQSAVGRGSTFHFTARFALRQASGQESGVRSQESGVRSQESPVAQTKAARGLSILLAEDNEVNQRLVVGMLGQHGHSVTVAATGREALALVDRQRFDVVLMDVQMPEMDGLEATAAIRARESSRGRHVPIIALTAHAMKGDRERCLAAGMDDYVSKPIDEEELLRALCSPRTVTLSRPVALTDDTVLSRPALLHRIGGDPDLLREVIALFRRTSGEHVSTIRKALAAGDTARLGRAAHTLKGAAGSLGASAVVEAARRVVAAGGRADLAGTAAELAALEEDLRRLDPHLDRLADELAESAAAPQC
jgi:CheY-like chemotaxis protein